MSGWIPWLIAAVSLGAFLAFWFRDVRRIVRERESTVNSAASQLISCRKKAGADPEAAVVLECSQSIYRQAVSIYNQTLGRPWVCLPAYLMGYRKIP